MLTNSPRLFPKYRSAIRTPLRTDLLSSIAGRLAIASCLSLPALYATNSLAQTSTFAAPAHSPAELPVPGTELAAMTLPVADLPDAPGTPYNAEVGSSSSTLGDPDGAQVDKTTPVSQPLSPAHPPKSLPTDMTVAPGQIAPPQRVHDKLIGSAKDAVSLFTLSGEIISAGYSHVTNGSPNFGTDAPAFGERVGASFARGTSQNLFYEGVMASVLHEDARYYELGTQVNPFHRLIYAGTRPLLTRTDGGRSTPNIALLSGYLGAAYLTRTYYPVLNQSNTEVFKTFGASLGGAALGYVVTEFLPTILTDLHLKSARHD